MAAVIPGTAMDYGSGYSTLGAPIEAPTNLFQGLGPAQLNTSLVPMQSYTPQYDIKQLSTSGGGLSGIYPTYSINGQIKTIMPGDMTIQNDQNSNVAGYNAVQQANAQNIGYLQQAAIAQNRLLGELNSRGLLTSFENGGAGTMDFQQLQNALNNAVNSRGTSLQNELSGLSQQDAMYQLALANYNNEYNQFNKAKNNTVPGFTDVLGLGGSALPLIAGI